MIFFNVCLKVHFKKSMYNIFLLENVAFYAINTLNLVIQQNKLIKFLLHVFKHTLKKI